MNGYTKLFSSIVSSTIWQEDLATKVVWITMLAMSDSDGNVEGSVPGLAHLAGVSLEECEQSLAKLQQPDRFSRTPDNEGRRIQVIDGGWFIVNRAKYRDLIPEESRRERDRLRQQRYRATVTLSRVTECDSHALSQPVAVERERERETVKETKSKSVSHFVRPTIQEIADYCQKRNNGIDPEKFFAYYESQGWYVGKKRMSNWKFAVITWEKNNYGGEFRDGYQKTGRIERQQLGTQAQRALNNIRAAEAAFMGSDSGADSPGQETRPSGGNSPTLEGEIKKLSGGHRL